jgi:hypothetical protein
MRNDGHRKLFRLSDISILDRLCGLVVRVPATDPEVPDSIPGATRFSEKK